MRRPYIAESAINPGCGVVQGSKDTQVKVSQNGSGLFIGVYAFEDNAAKEAKAPVGIAITGVAKVLAGGTVLAGAKAVLKADNSGTFIHVSTTAGQYATCGTFLESGASGEYVDMVIERGSVTIVEAE